MKEKQINKEKEFLYEICVSCNNLKIDTLHVSIYEHLINKITDKSIITQWGQRFKKNRLGIDLFYERQEAINTLKKFKIPYRIA